MTPDDHAGMFAPLTPEEAKASQPAGKPKAAAKAPLLPVPEDAPPAMGFRHPKHGAPTTLWPYRDAAGRLLCHVARFDFTSDDGTPGKDVLPLTFCDLGNGKRAWRSKGIPDPRPLYKLPELADRPDALVIVTEGEKTADAAAGLFPERATTTPMHGAKSPHKTDWSPLAGRRVVIWPDHDEPGASFAQSVAELATKAGAASVAMVHVPANWPPAWDLADEPPAGVTVEALRGMIEAARPWEPPAPASKPGKKAAPDSDDDDLPQRDRLILCATRGELWRDADHTAHATVGVDGHLESFAVRSTAYRRHLLKIYGARYQQVIAEGDTRITIPGSPSSQALADAMNSIDAIACNGPEKVPAVRVGEHEGRVVIDLGTADWSAVVIGPDGWEVVAHPPVPFIRPAGLRPLPVPVKGGRIADLRPFLNIGSDEDFRLAVAWIVACLKPNGPFPVMVVNGEQGAAKSTFCRVLRRLIDPNAADLRSPPKDERDALLAARNGWVLGYDNLSFIDGDQSDWFCRIATGGGFATRALYTNNEEVLIDVCRPVLLNGIPALASRPDLADRAVALTLPAMTAEARQPEGAFWTAFDAAAPRILGALFDGVSMALRNRATVTLARLPRMADFALWAAAAFPAFGWKPDQFVDAYETNRAQGVAEAVEADPVASAVLEIMADRDAWIGTATALLSDINLKVTPEVSRDKTWPKDGIRLSNRLRRVAPALRALGIEVVTGLHEGRGAERRRVIHVRQIKADPVPDPEWEETV
ncbi:hypothetical protein J2847_000458 [Azospirillum agricola]|uniref:hypothetical protein n=1 Tax=Azospirillum agricola TaxID=1720247 RepID=UPI001AE64165|nr:hypothetical protein [Azospirillum agricola]MBP2227191.1 hypothetical protein [Azospirillum agricola]